MMQLHICNLHYYGLNSDFPAEQYHTIVHTAKRELK